MELYEGLMILALVAVLYVIVVVVMQLLAINATINSYSKILDRESTTFQGVGVIFKDLRVSNEVLFCESVVALAMFTSGAISKDDFVNGNYVLDGKSVHNKVVPAYKKVVKVIGATWNIRDLYWYIKY